MESSFVLIRAGLTTFALCSKDQPSSAFGLKEKKKKFNKVLNKSLEQGLNLSGS
jgi:hypothetical protein